MRMIRITKVEMIGTRRTLPRMRGLRIMKMEMNGTMKTRMGIITRMRLK